MSNVTSNLYRKDGSQADINFIPANGPLMCSMVAPGFLWRRVDEKQFPARHQIVQELKSEKEDAVLAARAAGGGLKDKDINSDEAPL